MKDSYQNFFKQAQKVADKKSTSKPVQRMRAEDISVHQLRDRLKVKNQIKKNKNKYQVPWTLASVSFLGIILALFGMQYSQEVEIFLKKFEISIMGMASASEAAVAKPTSASQPASQSSNIVTEEELNHFAKLNERKKELDAREEELSRLESELNLQKVDLEKRLKDLEGSRRQISTVLEEKVQVDEKKIDALVQMYSTMKPQQAAKIFETMDEDLSIEILGRMKKKPAAEILNIIKPEKAQILSEKYAGYKRK